MTDTQEFEITDDGMLVKKETEDAEFEEDLTFDE